MHEHMYVTCEYVNMWMFYVHAQYELRERQKQKEPEKAQKKRNYVQHYMEQFLPTPEQLYVKWIFCSMH